jgi:hypothetical protein
LPSREKEKTRKLNEKYMKSPSRAALHGYNKFELKLYYKQAGRAPVEHRTVQIQSKELDRTQQTKTKQIVGAREIDRSQHGEHYLEQGSLPGPPLPRLELPDGRLEHPPPALLNPPNQPVEIP